jgi:hypothetical protein
MNTPKYVKETRPKKIAKYGEYKICCANCVNDSKCVINVTSSKGGKTYDLKQREQRRTNCKGYELDMPVESEGTNESALSI